MPIFKYSSGIALKEIGKINLFFQSLSQQEQKTFDNFEKQYGNKLQDIKNKVSSDITVNYLDCILRIIHSNSQNLNHPDFEHLLS